MSKKRLIDAYHGKATDTAPWVPYAGVHCAFLIKEKADRYLQDPSILSKGVVETAKSTTRTGFRSSLTSRWRPTPWVVS